MNMLAVLALAAAAQAVPDRVPWTSSRLEGTPDPPAPYRTEAAFSKLQFSSPLDLAPIPGSDLLAVAERNGRILTFRNRPEVEQADLLLRLDAEILGIAFHPRFSQNGFLYVAQLPREQGFVEVTRFTVRRGTASPQSRSPVIRWPVRGIYVHCGGALRFGPDGFLYIGVGDGSEAMDSKQTGQSLDDLWGSILRIDVDRGPRYLGYGIPGDNPFVGRAGARPEIWAYGLRQPWRMSFDRKTGELWAGDVGQELYESVLRIRPGGNYGWSLMEGGHPFRPAGPKGPTPVIAPVVVHAHTEFRAVIGGAVYRGERLPELSGSYVYGDHVTGRIWEVRLENERIVRHRELAVARMDLVSFGEDASGELYLLSFADGRIHRLVPADSQAPNTAFPRKLSETGLFASVADHRSAPGVVPYQVAAPLWSDGAAKDRLLAMPQSSRIRFEALPNKLVPRMAPSWEFPEGTALVKTFSLGGRRVETRILLLHKTAKAREIHSQAWQGYTYRWNEEQTDAELVEAAGKDVTVEVKEADGGVRRQSWRFPSRTECFMCHTLPAHFVLGVNTAQINREIEVAGRKVNQLARFQELGLFESPPPPAAGLERLVDYEDRSLAPDQRARSYLQANCAHCHVSAGGGNSPFQLLASVSLAESGLVDVSPVHGDRGLADARLLAPGDPERSMIRHRMGLTGEGRMPPLGTSRVDRQGVELLEEWIRSVPVLPRPPSPFPRAAAWGAALVFAALGFAGWRRFARPG